MVNKVDQSTYQIDFGRVKIGNINLNGCTVDYSRVGDRKVLLEFSFSIMEQLRYCQWRLYCGRPLSGRMEKNHFSFVNFKFYMYFRSCPKYTNRRLRIIVNSYYEFRSRMIRYFEFKSLIKMILYWLVLIDRTTIISNY